MRVAIPHTLGRDEVRRRLHARSGEIAGLLPGGIGDVQTGWKGEDHMDIAMSSMGHTIDVGVDVEDTAMVVTIDLPGSLSFLRGMVESAVRDKGTKLLK